jgi:4-amino-4-deoxy-L-arabinose transferase-like glycosyltransferase
MESAGRAEFAWLALLLVSATAVRFHALGEGLWYDEIVALVKYVRMPLGQILTTYDSQNQHLLYSVLAHGSVSMLGESIFSLRLPAVVLGIASLWAAYWFGRQVTGRREAFAATALLAFSYHHVWFSQNARGYTGLLFATLVGSGLFMRMLRDGGSHGRKPYIGYGLVMALGVYMHLTAVFVVAAHFCIWAYLAARRRISEREVSWSPFVAFGLAAALSAALYAPVLPQLLGTVLAPASGGVETDWQNPLWFVAELAGGLAAAVPGGWLGLVAGLVVGLVGVSSYARRVPSGLAVMALPGVLTMVVFAATRHNLWPRLLFFCFGFAALIAMRGLFELAAWMMRLLRPSGGEAASARLGIALAAAAVLVVGLGLDAAWNPKQDYWAAYRFVEQRRGPGDAVVTVDLAQFPYEQYIETGWGHVEDVAALRELERSNDRTWVVSTFRTRLEAVEPEIWSRIEAEYESVAEFRGTLNGGSITVEIFPSGADSP